MIGKINYLLPLYSLANNDQLKKIHKVLMTAARAAIGDYCFKKSTNFILKKCKWMTIQKMIVCSSVKFIHNVLKTQNPTVIFYLYKVGGRSIVKPVTKYKPKTKRMENFFLYKGLVDYNNLPNDILSAKNFKAEVKIYMMNKIVSDTHD